MTNDRVTISMARKIPAEQYGSIEIRVEYAMDKGEESRDEALIRCRKTVLAEFNRLMVLAGERVEEARNGGKRG